MMTNEPTGMYCPWGSNYQEVKGFDSVNRTRTWITNFIDRGLFLCSMFWDERRFIRFVDIG